MDTIYIPHLLNAPKQTAAIEIQESLPGLETLTPVKGRLTIAHKGTYLEVSAQAEAIITLTCHRCLQQYNHRLVVKTSELIWLDEAANETDDVPLEREVAVEDLVETLPPNGYFYPDDWLYQQMCLAMPQRQLCDSKCQGIQLSDTSASETITDSRWATLEALKKQLKNG